MLASARVSNGQVLSATTAGVTSWITPATGTVTLVTGTAPIVSSEGTTPAISITAATTSVAGSMSAADKTKLDGIATGTVAGQMQYWNGTAWDNVAPGTNGQTLTFCHGVPTWGACNPAIPDVSTTAITSITLTAASTGGNVTYDGESTVSVRGVCYNTNTGPTTANNPTPNGSGTGIFVSNLTGLTANTTYYLKAYAINGTGTAYGDEVSFKTLAVTIPILAATTAATSITAASASSGGNVTSDGGASI